MRHRKKIGLMALTVLVYLIAMSYLIAIGMVPVLIFAVYSGIVMTLAYSFYKKDIAAMQSGECCFKRNFPMRHYGAEIYNFQHVFTYEQDVLTKLLETIEDKLNTLKLMPRFKIVRFADVDKELNDPEKKMFYVSSANPTLRETTVTLVLHVSRFGQMQSVRWWLLLYGYSDWNKLFSFVVYAPFTMPFWIASHLKKNYDIVNTIRNIIPSFFNDVDVLTQIRSINNAVFNTLVEFLDNHHIDTSDLKVQRAQVLNITVSGGKTNFGNIVQGAKNVVQDKRLAHG